MYGQHSFIPLNCEFSINQILTLFGSAPLFTHDAIVPDIMYHININMHVCHIINNNTNIRFNHIGIATKFDFSIVKRLRYDCNINLHVNSDESVAKSYTMQ